MTIPLSRPDVTEEDIAAVVAVLRSPQLSLGPKLREFEEAVARYVDVPHAVALSSGTAGLQLGLQALEIGEGDEVIVPSFAFIAAANAIRFARAIPVFADIDPVTLNLDPASVERSITARTRAILVVHTFGVPADLDALLYIAGKHKLRVVEDACEAIGAEYGGRKVGGFGDFGVFSFYPNKPITTGEGGVLVTRNAGLADTVRALRNQGRRDEDGWLEHSLLGYNCRIPEMSCALGISQLRRLDAVLARRQEIAAEYSRALTVLPDVTTPPLQITGGRLCWFAYVVRLAPAFAAPVRTLVINEMAQRGVSCRAYFPPVHRQPLYEALARGRGNLTVTDDMAERTLALPFFNQLTSVEIRYVSQSLRESMAAVAERTADCR